MQADGCKQKDQAVPCITDDHGKEQSEEQQEPGTDVIFTISRYRAKDIKHRLDDPKSLAIFHQGRRIVLLTHRFKQISPAMGLCIGHEGLALGFGKISFDPSKILPTFEMGANLLKTHSHFHSLHLVGERIKICSTLAQIVLNGSECRFGLFDPFKQGIQSKLRNVQLACGNLSRKRSPDGGYGLHTRHGRKLNVGN